MEEFIGGINTMWGVVALVVFSTYKIIDYLIKNSHKKRSDYVLKSSFKDLSDKLDDHIEVDNKFGVEINLQVKRLELLQMMHQYPSKVTRIQSLYKDYKLMGGNSYIDDVFSEWLDDAQSKKRKPKAQK